MQSIIITVSFLFLLVTLRLVLAPAAYAHCPLCVAGAGAGLTLSRVLGIDDSITGVWLGSFLGAIAFWTQNILAKKNRVFSRQSFGLLLYLFILVSTIWSFYAFKLVGKHGDVLGYDKLTFGMVTGGVLFYLIDWINDFVIKKNKKVFFPYQRLVIGLGGIVVTSLGMYILINYFV